jgi:hypothetical protein
MAAYEKYRYGKPEQPEHGYLASIDPESIAYYTPTVPGRPGVPVEYDHGWCRILLDFNLGLTGSLL